MFCKESGLLLEGTIVLHMKSILLTTCAFMLLTVSCSDNSEKKIISVEKKIVYKQPVTVAANRQLAVEVTGMSCVHACGGAIRTALKNTNAVDRCSFDFVEERKTNTAFINFDKDKISADQILAIIQKLNNGQFTTGKTSTKILEEAVPATTSGTGTSSEGKAEDTKNIEVSSTSFELPNLFELFASIVC